MMHARNAHQRRHRERHALNCNTSTA